MRKQQPSGPAGGGSPGRLVEAMGVDHKNCLAGGSAQAERSSNHLLHLPGPACGPGGHLDVLWFMSAVAGSSEVCTRGRGVAI